MKQMVDQKLNLLKPFDYEITTIWEKARMKEIFLKQNISIY